MALSGAVLTLDLSENLKAKAGSLLGFHGDGAQVAPGVKLKAFLRLGSPLGVGDRVHAGGRRSWRISRPVDPELCAVTGAREGGEVTARLHACAKICRIVPVGDGVDQEDFSIAKARILEALAKKPIFPTTAQ